MFVLKMGDEDTNTDKDDEMPPYDEETQQLIEGIMHLVV